MIATLKAEEQHQHSNGLGWVANTAKVEPSVFVGLYAQVYDKAEITGKVRVLDTARISGTAKLSGSVVVYGNAWVSKGEYSGKERIHLNERVVQKAQRIR